MSNSAYEETLTEVAEELGYERHQLAEHFAAYLQKTELDPAVTAACYALYRITKLKGACRMTRRSREIWRDRAMELGWQEGEDNEPL